MDDVVPPNNFFFSAFGEALHKVQLISTSHKDYGNKKIGRNACGRVRYSGRFSMKLVSQPIAVMFGLFNSRFVRTLTFDNYVFPLNFVCSQLISAVENLWSLKVTELRGAW